MKEELNETCRWKYLPFLIFSNQLASSFWLHLNTVLTGCSLEFNDLTCTVALSCACLGRQWYLVIEPSFSHHHLLWFHKFVHLSLTGLSLSLVIHFMNGSFLLLLFFKFFLNFIFNINKRFWPMLGNRSIYEHFYWSDLFTYLIIHLLVHWSFFSWFCLCLFS